MSRLSQPPTAETARQRALAAAGVVLAVVAAYHNSFSGPFVFDDIPAIVNNPSLRHLSAIGDVLRPDLAGGETVSGRPLVNLSLALNHAWGGPGVVGYHVVNLLIHLAAALCLMGVVRRTLLSPSLAGRFANSALPLAAVSAALWAVHPLQTESVTYIVQRAESLVGLWCLFTLYAFIRSVGPGGSGGWRVVSVAGCLAGMATKEVMVAVPVLVFFYDRTFVAGTFSAAWRARRGYYIALALTWVPLAWLVAGSHGRGGTAGFATEITPWTYLLTQCEAIVHYLTLAVWPHPLVFDYGTRTVSGLGEVWWQALLLVALAGGVVVALRRRPVWGFLGLWCFALLAPSSSVVPVASQTMAEHRFYLPMAALAVALVVGLWSKLGRFTWPVAGALILAGVGLTVARNEDYRSEVTLWADTVAKQPANARAHNNLGHACFEAGRVDEAMRHYAEAIRLQPKEPEPHYNLGLALAKLGRQSEAVARYEEALRLQPAYAEAHNNLGNTLLALGRAGDAVGHYEEAVRLRPGFAEAHSNLANVLPDFKRGAEAVQHGELAVRLAPDNAEAWFNLGNAQAQTGRADRALESFTTALDLRPGYVGAANNRANALAELGRLPEAIEAYQVALRLNPAGVDARRNLARVLLHLGRQAEAVQVYQRLAEQLPGDAALREELAELRALRP